MSSRHFLTTDQSGASLELSLSNRPLCNFYIFIYFTVQTASRRDLVSIPAWSLRLCAANSQGTVQYNSSRGPCRHRQATVALLAHDCLDSACAKSRLRLCAISCCRRTCVHAVRPLRLSAFETLPASVGLSRAGWAPLWAPGQAGPSQQLGLCPWYAGLCQVCWQDLPGQTAKPCGTDSALQLTVTDLT